MARRSYGGGGGRSGGGQRRGGGGGRGRQQQAPQDTWTVTGIVEFIDEKRWGQATLYNVKLDDNELYGLGREHYDIQEGDEVELTVYENDRGYLTVVDGGARILGGDGDAPAEEPQEPARGRQQARGGRSGGRQGQGSGSGRSGRTREERQAEQDSKRRSKEEIQYAEARAAAQSTLHFLVENEIVNLGAKNKRAEREAAYYGMLDQLTAMFYDETASQAALARAGEARSGGTDEPDDAGDPDGQYDD